MHNLILKYGFLFLILLFFLSCDEQGKSKNNVLASVGEKKLYSSDLKDVIPGHLDIEDSISMAEEYINKWVKKQLMVQKAEENLSFQQKDLSNELEEYKNSLIIYRYKNELMRQRMDTTVTEEQILNYYENNTGNFNLTKNIVKAIFLKIPNEFADPTQLKSLCANPTEEDIIELRDFSIQYAKSYDIFTDRWVDFELVSKNIPQQIEEPDRFLKQNNTIELNDDDYYYLVSIQDYKLKNELAPVEFVRNNIKNLILNRRKIEFLKEIENNVYTEGIRKNKFTIYNN